SGVYSPKVGDMVMGKITELQSSGWIVDIDSYFDAYMPLSNVNEFIDTRRTTLDKYYAIGDVIYAKVVVVNGDSIHVSMQDTRSRKLRDGRIVKVNNAKVPRLIGKNGSMISLIKQGTNSRIRVGQNGFACLEDGNIELAVKAIKMIEKESHTEGLTEKISELLDIKPPKGEEYEEKKQQESERDETNQD
ncbi:MAG: KH domain-containing protein, partial [Candidatus Aenigmatarchaeota archaeon]